jgi:hypothetical protein
VTARVLAFASIVAAGIAGGFIGWSFTDLQCTGDCTVAAGVTGLATAVVAAVGVGIVAVLALRAIAEWNASTARSAGPPAERGLVARRSRRTPPPGDAPGGSGLPRVR